MVTFRTRSRLDMPRPLVTNPSLPAGRVALRCGGKVLVELESYGRGPKWTPRTGLQTGSVGSEAVRRWDDFPLVDSHCLSGPFGSWISCPDCFTRAGQSRGHLVALRPVWVPLPRWTRWLAGGTRWVYTFRSSSISASRGCLAISLGPFPWPKARRRSLVRLLAIRSTQVGQVMRLSGVWKS